jgi:hypothetical protein
MNGAVTRSRIPDLLITSQLLCQLSYDGFQDSSTHTKPRRRGNGPVEELSWKRPRKKPCQFCKSQRHALGSPLVQKPIRLLGEADPVACYGMIHIGRALPTRPKSHAGNTLKGGCISG